ncbi:MAG: 1,4-dihydroxy-2-naphthoate octaprenyltransferase [Candidatus Marinimicrobia bacterium]|nr:1,4-dihydroxy-2-naphthoate octaprenyltransferase [Candidatus Neomarinimicrobiota bacterium]|tara:strand:- start:75682 stop:76545 length:864 start_codon:yes stop_codon:yes gene_type:complete
MKIYPWIYAARPKTLVASIVPVIAATFILPKGIFKLDIFILTITTAIIIQITTNYINDLYDFLKGADKNRLGPERMLQSGKLTPQKIKKGIILLIILGLLLGIPLVQQGGMPIMLIGLSAFIFAYLYTGGPFSLAYHGLGDIFVFIYFGIIAVLGTYYLQTGTINYAGLYLGCSIGSNNTILLAINNLRDYNTDKITYKNTLIVILGQQFGKLEILIMSCLSYISFFLLASQLANYQLFYLILLSSPLSLYIIYEVYTISGKQLNQTLAKISYLSMLQCALLAIGIY